MQTLKRSTFEAMANIFAGIAIQFSLSFVVLRLQGLDVTWTSMTWYAAIMTVASFVRQFGIRRFFNWWDHGSSHRRKNINSGTQSQTAQGNADRSGI